MKFEFRRLREEDLPLLHEWLDGEPIGYIQSYRDPHPDNARAIRCYEKVGFKRAGEIVTPDGRALLMRLVR
ncbi:MAG TPA: hypothetical protein VLA33_00110 [Gemmatimonadota bacterium]|nr:hypothetical protein [Gemmatimonadota bacterium]